MPDFNSYQLRKWRYRCLDRDGDRCQMCYDKASGWWVDSQGNKLSKVKAWHPIIPTERKANVEVSHGGEKQES